MKKFIERILEKLGKNEDSINEAAPYIEQIEQTFQKLGNTILPLMDKLEELAKLAGDKLSELVEEFGDDRRALKKAFKESPEYKDLMNFKKETDVIGKKIEELGEAGEGKLTKRDIRKLTFQGNLGEMYKIIVESEEFKNYNNYIDNELPKEIEKIISKYPTKNITQEEKQKIKIEPKPEIKLPDDKPHKQFEKPEKGNSGGVGGAGNGSGNNPNTPNNTPNGGTNPGGVNSPGSPSGIPSGIPGAPSNPGGTQGGSTPSGPNGSTEGGLQQPATGQGASIPYIPGHGTPKDPVKKDTDTYVDGKTLNGALKTPKDLIAGLADNPEMLKAVELLKEGFGAPALGKPSDFNLDKSRGRFS